MKNYLKILSATTALIIINIAVFLLEIPLGGSLANHYINDTFTMVSPQVMSGEVWRLITSAFLHFGVMHIVFNMIALYNIGYFLETYTGTIKYLIIYLVGAVGGNLAVLLSDTISGNTGMTAGASGAIFAILGALLYVAIKDSNSGLSVPNMLSSILFALLPGFYMSGISVSAHIGGLVTGFILAFVLRIRNTYTMHN